MISKKFLLGGGTHPRLALLSATAVGILILLATGRAGMVLSARSTSPPAASSSLPDRATTAVIAGLTIPSLTGLLEARGMGCERLMVDERARHWWLCLQQEISLQEAVLSVGPDDLRVSGLHVLVKAEHPMADVDRVAGFLEYVASAEYEGAEPARARAWVREHMRGAATTLGNVGFRVTIDDAGGSWHLDMY